MDLSHLSPEQRQKLLDYFARLLAQKQPQPAKPPQL